MDLARRCRASLPIHMPITSSNMNWNSVDWVKWHNYATIGLTNNGSRFMICSVEVVGLVSLIRPDPCATYDSNRAATYIRQRTSSGAFIMLTSASRLTLTLLQYKLASDAGNLDTGWYVWYSDASS